MVGGRIPAVCMLALLVVKVFGPPGSVLSNMVAPGHTWLSSTWNVASLSWDGIAHVKHKLDFRPSVEYNVKDLMDNLYLTTYWNNKNFNILIPIKYISEMAFHLSFYFFNVATRKFKSHMRLVLCICWAALPWAFQMGWTHPCWYEDVYHSDWFESEWGW